ncbi:hypothetical protein D3C85_1681240 [compost metagenome]
MAFVGSDPLIVGGSDAGNDKGFVDVDSTADGIDDFQAHKEVSSLRCIGVGSIDCLPSNKRVMFIQR